MKGLEEGRQIVTMCELNSSVDCKLTSNHLSIRAASTFAYTHRQCNGKYLMFNKMKKRRKRTYQEPKIKHSCCVLRVCVCSPILLGLIHASWIPKSCSILVGVFQPKPNWIWKIYNPTWLVVSRLDPSWADLHVLLEEVTKPGSLALLVGDH